MKCSFAVIFCIVFCTIVARELDPEEVPNLYEGDIALPSESDEIIEARNTLNSKKFKKRLWPNRKIPYAISPLYSASETIMISKAIRMIGFMTCVEFVPWEGRKRSTRGRKSKKEDLLLIWPVKYPKGCWSYIGRVGGVQILSLEKERDVDDALDDAGSEQIDEAHERLSDVASWIRQKFGFTDPTVPKTKKSRKRGCFGSEGRVIHELLHAMGMFHEQSRPDRDKFIEINWDNVVPGYKNNFSKQSKLNATHNFEYDFLSVMHYGQTYFSRSQNMPTITVKKKYLKKYDEDAVETPLGESLNIGQRIGMTKFDCLKVNDLYVCLDNDIMRIKYYHLCRTMGL